MTGTVWNAKDHKLSVKAEYHIAGQLWAVRVLTGKNAGQILKMTRTFLNEHFTKD